MSGKDVPDEAVKSEEVSKEELAQPATQSSSQIQAQAPATLSSSQTQSQVPTEEEGKDKTDAELVESQPSSSKSSRGKLSHVKITSSSAELLKYGSPSYPLDQKKV